MLLFFLRVRAKTHYALERVEVLPNKQGKRGMYFAHGTSLFQRCFFYPLVRALSRK